MINNYLPPASVFAEHTEKGNKQYTNDGLIMERKLDEIHENLIPTKLTTIPYSKALTTQ